MKLSVRSILVYLTIAFVVFAIWNAPTTTGNAVGDFLGSLGNGIAELVNRGADFLQGISN